MNIKKEDEEIISNVSCDNPAQAVQIKKEKNVEEGDSNNVEKDETYKLERDNWLRQSFEGKDDEDVKKPRVPVIIRIRKLNKKQKVSGNDQAPCSVVESQMNNNKRKIESNSSTKTGKSDISISEVFVEETIKVIRCRRPKDAVSVVSEAPVSETAATGLCTFKCPFCSALYSSWDKFYQHIKNKHQKLVNKADHESFLTKAVVHICRVCSARICCDSKFLSNHLLEKHSMNLTKYRQKFDCEADYKVEHQEQLKKSEVSNDFLGNMCKFKCPECHRNFASFSSFRKHGDDKKCIFDSTLHNRSKYTIEAVSHQCKICKSNMLCDMNIIQQHVKKLHKMTLKEYSNKTGCVVQSISKVDEGTFLELTKGAKTSKKVDNLCQFTCKKCKCLTDNWRDMRDHLKHKNHWLPAGKQWSLYISEVVIHKCKICKRAILNDRAFVVNHLKKVHNLSLIEYENN